MVEYDSDSSGADDIETGVTLGYASKEPTGDDFSQLGGHPTWLESQAPPSGNLAKCKVCNGLLNALFQLNGNLPDRFPAHERRLYLFGCRRKACRRKDGSIRGLRYCQVDADAARQPLKQSDPKVATVPTPASNLGNALFGVGQMQPAKTTNPFAAPASSTNPFGAPSGSSGNRFAAATGSSGTHSTTTGTPAPVSQSSINSELSQTFAEKARIVAASTSPKAVQGPAEPWPETSVFPKPYPSYFVDADREFLSPEPEEVPQQTRIEEPETETGGSSASDDKTTFESTMDKAFQKFADRVGQNPEQILRYEFGGQPLLYSKKDAVGKAWPRIPRCTKCGSQRQFELQLTPHAITELEAEDDSLEGMDWGTIILAVCGNDCEGWCEEWVGVQWEELAKAA